MEYSFFLLFLETHVSENVVLAVSTNQIYLYTCQSLHIFNYLMEYSFFLLFFWKTHVSENDCCFRLYQSNIFIYTCSILHIYSTFSLEYSFFSTFFWKHHMFRKCCLNYHEIFIYVNLTYINFFHGTLSFLLFCLFLLFFGNSG